MCKAQGFLGRVGALVPSSTRPESAPLPWHAQRNQQAPHSTRSIRQVPADYFRWTNTVRNQEVNHHSITYSSTLYQITTCLSLHHRYFMNLSPVRVPSLCQSLAVSLDAPSPGATHADRTPTRRFHSSWFGEVGLCAAVRSIRFGSATPNLNTTLGPAGVSEDAVGLCLALPWLPMGIAHPGACRFDALPGTPPRTCSNRNRARTDACVSRQKDAAVGGNRTAARAIPIRLYPERFERSLGLCSSLRTCLRNGH